jgi:hypothetical protein
MSTQDAILSGNQYVSDGGQEQEQSLQVEASGNRMDEIGTGESTSPAQISHHRTCCCESCWPNNINSYL